MEIFALVLLILLLLLLGFRRTVVPEVMMELELRLLAQVIGIGIDHHVLVVLHLIKRLASAKGSR